MIVSTKNIFNVVDISSLKSSVGHPNGTMAKIITIGSLRLTENVVLFDVLVIPKYTVNLLSVNKMIKDSKYFMSFDKSECYIQDLKLEKIMGTGSESGGLYMFDCDNNGKSFTGLCNSGIVCYVSKELWHCRLGHLADQVLSVLSDKIGFKTSDHVSACDVCHREKQTREPFSLSDHKSYKMGDLVPLDVWGPYKVTSRWVNVKIIRSDNGTEFVNNKMSDLFTSLGIVHQTSCSYTPQQNGIVERKHRHLLNVARSLMLPSSFLSDASPFKIVYGKEPSLSHLRAFGCLSCLTMLNNSDKFGVKSEKYVLIGFSIVKKAYKLYSLDNKTMLFLRDVKFYETVFPFKMQDLSKNTCVTDDTSTEVDWLCFFDTKSSQSPNDKEGDTSNEDSNCNTS
ncbi:putative RNA-directed DNA polymerase [Tanacetum coccineum]